MVAALFLGGFVSFDHEVIAHDKELISFCQWFMMDNGGTDSDKSETAPLGLRDFGSKLPEAI